MFKKATVVMLPTNEKAPIIKQIDSLYHLISIPSYEWSLTQNWQYQHLYIVSDDKIKENDWYIGDFKEIKQATNFTIPYINGCDNFKKIIATTDQSLLVPAYTISNIPLPQPSQQFIEKYIEEYNKGNVITEVMVEYYWEPFSGIAQLPAKLKVNSKDNTITIRRTKDSWNREEHSKALKNAIEQAIMYPEKFVTGITCDTDKIKNWIKENL